LYSTFPFILAAEALLIGIVVIIYLYVKKKKGGNYSLADNTFIKDCIIINAHLRNELRYVMAFIESFFVIAACIKLAAGTPLASSFWGVLLLCSTIISYSRYYIVRFCNPKAIHGWPPHALPVLAATATGGAFWFRDASLNSMNPPIFPYVTAWIQQANWGYYNLDRDMLWKEKYIRSYNASIKLPLTTHTDSWGFSWTTIHKEKLEMIYQEVKGREGKKYVPEEFEKIYLEDKTKKEPATLEGKKKTSLENYKNQLVTEENAQKQQI
jgi:hypothetical protein